MIGVVRAVETVWATIRAAQEAFVLSLSATGFLARKGPVLFPERTFIAQVG